MFPCCAFEITRETRTKLSELLSHPTDPMLGWEVVDKILEGEGVFLILDGLDEFSSTILKEDHSLIWQLISGSCLPKAKVVVTSRPPQGCRLNHVKLRRASTLKLLDLLRKTE